MPGTSAGAGAVSLVCLMTAVSALAQLTTPVPFGRPAEASHHRAAG